MPHVAGMEPIAIARFCYHFTAELAVLLSRRF